MCFYRWFWFIRGHNRVYWIIFKNSYIWHVIYEILTNKTTFLRFFKGNCIFKIFWNYLYFNNLIKKLNIIAIILFCCMYPVYRSNMIVQSPSAQVADGLVGSAANTKHAEVDPYSEPFSKGGHKTSRIRPSPYFFLIIFLP